jgi:hypothetical protein
MVLMYVVANSAGQVSVWPRRALDPRRPIGRKPTQHEAEEGLAQYEALLPDDPRRIVSHNYEVSFGLYTLERELTLLAGSANAQADHVACVA